MGQFSGVRSESDLLRGEVDVAFRFLPQGKRPTQQLLVAQKLGGEPFALYATDAYLRRRGAPAQPDILAGHDVVIPVSAAIARATGWLVVHPHGRGEPRVRAVVDLLADSFRGPAERVRTA